MKRQLAVLAAVFAVVHATAALAQTATGTAKPPTAATSMTPVMDHAAAYNALSEDNRKIVRAIYEAQLGSPKDAGAGSLLTKDEIAVMRQKTSWDNVYRQLHQRGMVIEKNLGQALSSYNQSAKAGISDVTVISTAGGEQIAIKKEKPGSTASPMEKAGKTAKTNNTTAKADPAKSTAVTTAGGDAATAGPAAVGAAAVR